MSALTATPEQVEEVLSRIATLCNTMVDACSDTINDGPQADASQFAAIAQLAFLQVGVLADGLNGFDCMGSASAWIAGFDMPNYRSNRGDAS